MSHLLRHIHFQCHYIPLHVNFRKYPCPMSPYYTSIVNILFKEMPTSHITLYLYHSILGNTHVPCHPISLSFYLRTRPRPMSPYISIILFKETPTSHVTIYLYHPI